MKKQRQVANPFILILLSIISGLIILFVIRLEYKARETDYETMLKRQAELFIGSMSNTIQNALTSAALLEQNINDRIISSLKIIEILDSPNSIKKTDLERIRREIDLDALLIYDASGNKYRQTLKDSDRHFNIPQALIKSRITRADTILKVNDAQQMTSEFLAAFVKLNKGGLLVAVIAEKEVYALRNIVGIGYLMKRLQSEQDVEYLVIQNSLTIVAGSFNGYALSTFRNDSLLGRVLENQQPQTRTLSFANTPVFEAVAPFSLNNNPFGVLRLGLSMDDYIRMREAMQRRMYILLAVLVIIGIIVINFLIIYRQRFLLQRDLSRLKQYTNTVLENLISGVIHIDRDGLIQTINKQAVQLLKLESKDPQKKHFTVLNPELTEVIRQNLKTFLAEPFEKNILLKTANQERLCAIRIGSLRESSQHWSTVLLIDDITNQMLLQETRMRNEKLASMRNLASSVAHEIKNPLNAIKLIIDLLARKQKLDIVSDKKQLQLISSEIDRLSEIINQYMQFNRPPDLNIEPVEIVPLLKDVLELFRPDFYANKISLEQHLIKEIKIEADRQQLKQVFINILKNAYEAIEAPGKIEIEGTIKNSFYEIVIKDDGNGIDQNKLKSVFDIHFTTKKGGSGIGLSVVQQIIDAHAGRIHITSQVGQGTCVRINLPLPETQRLNEGQK